MHLEGFQELETSKKKNETTNFYLMIACALAAQQSLGGRQPQQQHDGDVAAQPSNAAVTALFGPSQPARLDVAGTHAPPMNTADVPHVEPPPYSRY
jgi:hypothetical protein